MRPFALLLLVCALAACTSDRSAAPAPPEAPAPTSDPPPPSADGVITILYLGDSLTAGYGLPGGPDEAYPALIQARLEALGIPARTINAGVSGDTSSGGRSRLGWYLARHRVDVLVLALGANDGLRGLPTETLRENLEAIIDETRRANPEVRVVLAGMMIPPSMGSDYFERFAAVYPEVARTKDVDLVPFLLEGVGGVPELNQPDGVHPTAEGQRRMAETVWQTLGPIVEALHAERAAAS